MMPLPHRTFGLCRSLTFLGLMLALLPARVEAQNADLAARVAAAADRLAAQSYRWETRASVVGDAATPAAEPQVVAAGQKHGDGHIFVDGVLANAGAEFVTREGKAAVLVDGNWMTLEQSVARATAGRGGRGRGGPAGRGGATLGDAVNAFQPPPVEVRQLLTSATNFRAEGNVVTADLPAATATSLFESVNTVVGAAGRGGRGRGGLGRGAPPRGGRGRGAGPGARGAGGRGRGGFAPPTFNDVSGTIAFTLTDNTLSNIKISLAATQVQGEESTRVQRELATAITDIGGAQPELASDAKEIVASLIAGVEPNIYIPEVGFRKLFNGRDLSGWAGQQGLWTVEDGAIVGRTTPDRRITANTFLIAKNGNENLNVTDFELRFSYKVTPNANGFSNSGVQYRSQDRGNFVVSGYQADLMASGNHGGILFEEGGRGVMAEQGEVVYWTADGKKSVISRLGEIEKIQAAIRPNEWNEYVVIANQNHLQHFINGVPTVDVTDNDPALQKRAGVLALQLHAEEPMTVAFKDIRIRDIKPISESPAASLEVADGFQIELLYRVPGAVEGSWVASCIDNKGRMIVSDQAGELYRFELPPVGQLTQLQLEPIGLGMGRAHGLLYAFDSLYSVGGGPEGTGLYRIRDTNGDDKYDEAKLLRSLTVGTDHSAHVAIVSPDGEGLLVVSGNQTPLTKIDSSRVPPNISEDHLLRRMLLGFMDDVMAPGGWIARTDPNGEKWEFIGGGFRNEFDAALNRDGEIFTYDADMELDIGAPWYRPTRVNHVISGADFGWRTGAGKHPDYLFDTFGAVVNIGTGSPTGVGFGYGAKFPAKYQEALYICDWSYGKVYAVHLTPDGATYKAEFEEFVAGQPLPVTDVIINPNDGAMYLTVGGRTTQSAVYRVTYIGDESTEPYVPEVTPEAAQAQQARALRKSLEQYHGHASAGAIATAWPHLGNPDRAIRYAARIAVEWQPVAEWREKALSETNPRIAIAALAALARVSTKDETHRQASDPAPDAALLGQIVSALNRIDISALPQADRVDLLRAYQLAFIRLGAPSDEVRQALIAKFDPLFPSKFRDENYLLSNLLVYLEAPSAAGKIMALIRESQSQEEQVDYALTLRVLKTGWTMPLREEYFTWFIERAGSFRGGGTFSSGLRNLQSESIEMLSEQEYAALARIIESQPKQASPQELLAARPLVREWTLDEAVTVAENGLRDKGRSYEQGRRAFNAVACNVCHRFANEGGAIGPDLTNVIGRYTPRDLLESVVNPSKVVSDQYTAIQIQTVDGRVIVGRIANMQNNNISVVEDMLGGGRTTSINRDLIETIQPSPVSMMPAGLLNTLTAEEIQDLVAYLYSRGNPEHELFQTRGN